jgi:uncharacterized protein (TIGR02421 family)
VKKKQAARRIIDDRFIEAVTARLADDLRIRRTLPEGGRLHIDRPLPFLCVYRRPPGGDDGTERLVTTEASYLVGSGSSGQAAGLGRLAEAVVATVAPEFGAFLIVEILAGAPASPEAEGAAAGPSFHLIAPRREELDEFLDAFERELSRVRLGRARADVRVTESGRVLPAGLAPLISAAAARAANCFVLGLEVRPVYRDVRTGDVYPLVLRELRRNLCVALKRSFYAFTNTLTTQRPRHYHVLGRRAVVKAVWNVDRGLAEVADGFDFLLQVTPVNSAQAWNSFRRSRYQRPPVLRYRPSPVDPLLLKRKLFAVPLERVEDPAIFSLFREKQDELDRKLTMLLDINTPRFVHGSIQLYGEVGEESLATAEDLLDRLPPRSRDDPRGGTLDADAMAERARREIEHYRRQWPEVRAEVEVRPDIASGLMVSHGNLLIGAESRIPAARADALLSHEIGTHVLTYYNGRAQPFRQLYSGLAGYDALQEGLAVLGEHLVGGLSRPRLRLLAARVVAVRRLTEGASFVDVFRELVRDHGFDRRTAFTIAGRVYRGGGLTKDAVYLQGLLDVLAYIERDGDLEPLLVGKIAASHVPVIRELTWRGVLRDPPLKPRYLDSDDGRRRLERLRGGVTVFELAERRGR